MANPYFSIIICTRNRAALLRKSLASIKEIDYPEDDFELLVIDNNSSDDTKTLVQGFSKNASLAVRYIFEEKAGLSPARNTAIRNAKGRYLIFTDDDMLVEKNILNEHRKVSEKYGARVVQGSIDLVFPAGRPSWLNNNLAKWLCKTSYDGEGEADIDLIGGHMAFRRDIFEKFGGFKENLGKGAPGGWGEDAELGRRLASSGEKIFFAPAAKVHHIITPDRATKRYFRKMAYEKGSSYAVFSRMKDPLPAVALHTLWRMVNLVREIVYHSLKGNESASVLAQMQALYSTGFLVGYIRNRYREPDERLRP